MRPLKLTMQAFGSYGARTVIDFTAPNQNLFLVTGDTGSGKTTIFDAIVFALYGQASSERNKKDGTELQSQYAGRDVTPFVEFKFSEVTGGRQQTYVVTRIPRHVRKLQRRSRSNPDGLRVDNESVSMILLPDEDASEGTVVAQSRLEINRKIEEIVGLSKDQFMQVAMIAQGEFMDLLRANSDSKKKTFSRLFHTGIYQEIVDEISGRLRRTRGQNMSLMEVCKSYVRQTELPPENGADNDLYSRLRSEKEKLTSTELFALTRFSDFRTDLTALTEELEKKKEEADGARKAAGRFRDQARDALARAESLEASFRQLNQAEQTLKNCEMKRDAMRQKEKLLKKIELSHEILGHYRPYRDALKKKKETEEEIAKLTAEIPRLRSSAADAAAALKKASGDRDQALAAQSAVAEKAARCASVFKNLRTAKTDADQKRSAADAARKKADGSSARIQVLDDRVKKEKEKIRSLDGADRKLEHIRGILEMEENLQLRILKKREDADDAVLAAETARLDKEAYAAADRKYADAVRNYQRMRRIFFDNLAGVIASDLKENEPCPVCGSVDHPHPATKKSEEKVLSREDLDTLEEEVRMFDAEMQERSKKSGSAAASADEKRRNVIASARPLLEEAGKYIEMDRAGGADQPMTLEKLKQALENADRLLEVKIEANKKEEQKAEQASKALADAQKAADAYVKELEAEKEEAERLKEAASRAESLAKSSEAVFRNLKDTPRDFHTEEEAALAGKTASDAVGKADREYRNADRKESEIRTQLEKASALLTDRRENLPKLAKDADEAGAAYREAVNKSGLTESEWTETVKEWPDGRTAASAIREELGAYSEEENSARKLKAASLETIAGRREPDMDELQKACGLAETRYQEAEGKAEKAGRILQVNRGALDGLTVKLEEGEKSAKLEEQLSHLYGFLAGKVTGSRMDIETFVQRYYLEHILKRANARFREMSMGQFELRMVDLEHAGSGRNRGLDLMVYSYVTGQEREVRTLSGGESFIASLSLALGMADQITANRSSIHLDMMFIDEGFGTLDERSREQAVRVLRKMAGGTKLIGIISHVTELKQEMEDQLIVTKDEKGSHVRWQIS